MWHLCHLLLVTTLGVKPWISLTLRSRAGGSGRGRSHQWLTVILESFHRLWEFINRILPLRNFVVFFLSELQETQNPALYHEDVRQDGLSPMIHVTPKCHFSLGVIHVTLVPSSRFALSGWNVCSLTLKSLMSCYRK